MKPTQEQILQWAREAGVGKAFVCAKPDECPDDDGCCHQNKQDGYWVQDDKFLAALTFAYEAGRKDENEACAKVCDEQEQRSRESSEKSKRERDQFMYHHCAVTAKWNAAAIRARREQ